jgi:DNA polymerase III epsilon subunit-like protein
MEDVTGSTAIELAPTGSGDLVEQLNAATARTAWGWWAIAAVFVLGLPLMPYGLILWAVLAPLCIWLVLNDQARKTVVLFYDVRDEHYSWFDSLATSWGWFTGSQRTWRVLQEGAVTTTHQFKTNSGASHVIKRVAVAATTAGPKQLSTNIAVPSLTAGSAALYFLPDRILVREGKHFSDVSYSQLGVRSGQTQFIESNSLPGDATQVGQTWQYVNVKGGPDRRYKNNRILPIMLYGTADFTSTQGLQWQLQVSRADATTAVARVLTAAPSSSPSAAPVTPKPTEPVVLTPKHRKVEPKRKSAPKPQPKAAVTTRTGPARTSPKAGITRANLTRTVTAHPAARLTFTAIDIETTGLDPDRDRIVEIGLVKFTADGTVIDEFATLVNHPGSSPEARAIHCIDDADLADAPSIEQVLPEAFAFMSGTVLLAHKLDFEEGFLIAAARRAGIPLPQLVGMCTWQASRRQLDGRAFSLVAMYKTATGSWNDQKHTALGDARAVAEVMLWLLKSSPKPLHLTTAPIPAAPKTFAPCPISCRPVPMQRASVAELLSSFPRSHTPRTGEPAEISKYKIVLADAVDDGRLTYEEAEALTRQARRTRLTGPQLLDLHQQAWEATYPDEKDADWASLGPVQRREMYLLADALGLTELAKDIHVVIEACAELDPPAEARYLRGLRIAILGDHSEVVDLRKHAESYGAKLAINITKTVQWMVTVTPNATDSRHTTARNLGIPIIYPAEGWTRLNEATREAELKAFERQRTIDEAAAYRQQRAAENDAYWRPTWRTEELDHDPEFEPW